MSDAYLIASSMLTSVGQDAKRVHYSIAAGINRYQETDILSVCGNPIRMALVPPSTIETVLCSAAQTLNSRQRRLLRLAHSAMRDIKHALPDTSIPIFIAGPEAYTTGCGIDRKWIECLGESSGVKLDVANSRFVNIGRAGAADMLDIATRYFEATQAPYAIVGGVDSFYHVATLDFLEDRQRLLGPTTPFGFVPGEGSGFLLFASSFAPQEKTRNCLARIQPPNIGCESMGLDDMREATGGLSKVFEQLTDHSKPEIETIYSCENGEPHLSTELATAIMRHRTQFSEHKKVIRPAEYFGDVGAAFGAIAIGLAAEELQQKNKHAPIVIACASDSGARAVLRIGRAEETMRNDHQCSQSQTA